MNGKGEIRLTAGMIRTNPVLSLETWAKRYWSGSNPALSGKQLAEQLRKWIDAGVHWPAHGTSKFLAQGWLPEEPAFPCQPCTPRVVGLVYDSQNDIGVVNPLVTEISDRLSHSSLLPFDAKGIRSLLIRLCDSSENALAGGIPESTGFSFQESLGEQCIGNSMDIAGLLSALDAISEKTCSLFSAACAVVEPGYQQSLTPVGSISAKLKAFVREYDRGSLLVACKGCKESEHFLGRFEHHWFVDSLPELASKIAALEGVRERLSRSGPLNITQTNSILGQLDHLIEYCRDNPSAIHLCDRVKAAGFMEDVPHFQRLKIKRRHADSLRHSGRFKDSLNVVNEIKDMLDGCREVLSLDDETGHAIANASALFDACDFEAAADWLREPLETCSNTPRSISAQNRVEVYNTMARIMVMTCQHGWEELLKESIRLQHFFDPASIRRTESYRVHGLLRHGQLDEAEALIVRHEADDKADAFSQRFTVFYRCELNRQRGQISSPPDTEVKCYTTAFALQACARQIGRATAERVQLLEKAERILLDLTKGKEEGNLLALIAAAVSLTAAVAGNDRDRWTDAVTRLSKLAEMFGKPALGYLRPTLETLGNIPSADACERLLRLMPYL